MLGITVENKRAFKNCEAASLESLFRVSKQALRPLTNKTHSLCVNECLWCVLAVFCKKEPSLCPTGHNTLLTRQTREAAGRRTEEDASRKGQMDGRG